MRTKGGGPAKIVTLSEGGERECNKRINNWPKMETKSLTGLKYSYAKARSEQIKDGLRASPCWG